MKILIHSIVHLAFVVVVFGFSLSAQAVSPPPDGGYPGQNTAEGQSALLHVSSGAYNTAVGWYSLAFDVTGQLNTAVGAGALLFNTADWNTAIGAAALLDNTTGSNNSAFGFSTMDLNTTGHNNTAIGTGALSFNTAGSGNTAIGMEALEFNTTGNANTVLGISAGSNLTTASNVICIGAVGNNVDDSCYIANIFGATSSGGVGVFVNSNGRLGTTTSSRRFKEDIKPLDKASEAVLLLKPVSFRYKKEVDPEGTNGVQFGLVAEDVEKVNRDLIVRDKEGKPYSVRYDQVNAMLLNEFLKEHQTVEALKKQVAELTAGLQKVSALLELNKPARQTVLNNQ